MSVTKTTIGEIQKKRQEYLKWCDDIIKNYVKPHKKKSRPCKEKYIPEILKAAKIMKSLCYVQHNRSGGALAIAHPQINKKKPLRFFVFRDGQIIINPIITKHTNSFVDSKEGCTSFLDRPSIIVNRWNKITVEYYRIADLKNFSGKVTEKIDGKESKIYQHEIDHFDGKYIYDK